MVKHILLIILPILMMAQIEPIENLHDNQPRVWTLTHAMIHTSPGNFIKNGSITIRNGKIEAVGRYIKTPRDAFEIDLKGAHVYAGFIESWLETEALNEKSKSTRMDSNHHFSSPKILQTCSVGLRRVRVIKVLRCHRSLLFPDCFYH